MVIDIHTHVFPDVLAQRALCSISRSASAPYYADGTVAGTQERLLQWKVDAQVALHIATKPTQQTTINNWAASIQTDRLFCFGSIHPDAKNAMEEIRRIRELGLYGIKLHPDYQGFFADEKRMMPLYDRMQEMGLPLLFHAGWDPYSPDCTHATAASIAKIATCFPDLTIIAAHMGSLNGYDDTERYLLEADNLYLDTSMSSVYCKPEQFSRIIAAKGADHILFGSDCPWSRADRERDFLLQHANLTESEAEMILSQNAIRVLHLPL